MRSLTAKQRAYVNALVETGNMTRAMREAGYVGKPRSLRTQRYRLTHDERIRAEVEAATRQAFALDAPIARKRLLHLVEHAKSEAVQVRAAEILLDRGLGLLAEQHEHRHMHIVADLSPEEVRARRDALRERLGLGRAPIVDGAPACPAAASTEKNSAISGENAAQDSIRGNAGVSGAEIEAQR